MIKSNKIKRETLVELAKQAYLEVLKEHTIIENLTTVLPDASQEILQKFPKLQKTLVRLMTSNYDAFVENVEWISPKPTAFKVTIKNGQTFTLTWMGKNFRAIIGGKTYYLGQVQDFQNALAKLAELYSETPTGGDKEEDEIESGQDNLFDAPEGGLGDEDFGGEDLGDEGGEDLGGEEIDFEDPVD